MVFHSKIDQSYKILITVAIIITGIATLSPIFIDDQITTVDIIVLSSIFGGSILFLLWMSFTVKYIFLEECLLVKGGPFRSRIRYEDMTKIAKTNDLMTGFRLSLSADSIEIFYRTGFMGSVKISPEEQSVFIEEIQKRCVHVKVEV